MSVFIDGLTKTQVKALLDVVPSDTMKPALNRLAIVSDKDGRTHVAATDGYRAVLFDARELDDIKGSFVGRSDLIRWYKLADKRDRLTSDNLREYAKIGDDGHPYPDIFNILTSRETAAIDKIAMDPSYLLTFERLAGFIPTYTTHGSGGYWLANIRHGDVQLIVMPRKIVE